MPLYSGPFGPVLKFEFFSHSVPEKKVDFRRPENTNPRTQSLEKKLIEKTSCSYQQCLMFSAS